MDNTRRGGYNYNYSRNRGRNRKWNNASRRVSPYSYKYPYNYNQKPSHAPPFNQPNRYPTFQEIKRLTNQPARPASPIEGSEEYMSLKIQQQSALVMRHLLSPNEPIISKQQNPIIETIVINDAAEVVCANNDIDNTKKSLNKNKKSNCVKAKDIYEKIRNYLTKLGKSKMTNFINANSSSYLNSVITQMQQQERLEFSRILRDMNSSGAAGAAATDGNNSINPDLLLNMEELPEDVIKTLERTLNIDLSFFNESLDPEICIKNEIISNEEFVSNEATMGKLCTEHGLVQEESMEHPKEVPVEDKVIEDLVPDKECMKDLQVKQELIEDLPNGEFMEDESMKSHPPVSVEEESMENHLSVTVKEESMEDLSPTGEFIVNGKLIEDPLPTEALLNNVQVKEESGNSLDASPTNLLVPKPMIQCKVEDEDSFNISLEHFDPKTLLDSSIDKVEASLKNIVEAESKKSHTNVDAILVNINLIDECCKHLNDYKNVLIKALANRSEDCKCSEKVTEELNEEVEEEVINFSGVQGLVTVIKLIDNQLLLGTKSGNVIFASKKDGTIQHTINVTNQSITSLAFISNGLNKRTLMYVGSLDMVLRIYDLKTKEKLCEHGVSDQIRCMDSKWGYVFIGCKDGNLLRYSSEKSRLDFELNNLNLEIFSLKATEEGARRVLIVGHRGAEIFVRDAMTGLFLRNFAFGKPTVYSLEFNDSSGSLYCGTAKDNLLVYDFNQGRLVQVFKVNDKPPGISCLKFIKNVLFVGCYDGFVYVFNTLTSEKIATLQGPGGGIVCMQVMSKQLILSTLNYKIGAVNLPDNIVLNK